MPRILVIDDNADARAALVRLLKVEGYDVAQAADGAAGIARVKKDRFDLIITDIFMPGKEGIETISEIKKDDPSAKIIAISAGIAGISSSPLDSAGLVGAVQTFQRPFDAGEFLKAVGAYCAAGKT